MSTTTMGKTLFLVAVCFVLSSNSSMAMDSGRSEIPTFGIQAGMRVGSDYGRAKVSTIGFSLGVNFDTRFGYNSALSFGADITSLSTSGGSTDGVTGVIVSFKGNAVRKKSVNFMPYVGVGLGRKWGFGSGNCIFGRFGLSVLNWTSGSSGVGIDAGVLIIRPTSDAVGGSSEHLLLRFTVQFG